MSHGAVPRTVAPMLPVEESRLRFPAGRLVLEGRLSVPEGAVAGCVVCHPHPLYGGDMHNPVVVAVTAALREAGIATLRFDFRGTGESDGIHSGGDGEVKDAGAALDALASEAGVARLAMAGYSFGAWIAARLASLDPRPSAVAAIAPPLGMVDPASIPSSPTPLLLLAGDRDSSCPVEAMEGLAATRPSCRASVLRNADHFLGGREREAAAEAVRFLAAALGSRREAGTGSLG